jgi:hypothetical protein
MEATWRFFASLLASLFAYLLLCFCPVVRPFRGAGFPPRGQAGSPSSETAASKTSHCCFLLSSTYSGVYPSHSHGVTSSPKIFCNNGRNANSRTRPPVSSSAVVIFDPSNRTIVASFEPCAMPTEAAQKLNRKRHRDLNSHPAILSAFRVPIFRPSTDIASALQPVAHFRGEAPTTPPPNRRTGAFARFFCSISRPSSLCALLRSRKRPRSSRAVPSRLSRRSNPARTCRGAGPTPSDEASVLPRAVLSASGPCSSTHS